MALKCTRKLVHFYSQLVPIFTNISSITLLLYSLNIFLLIHTNFQSSLFQFLRRMMNDDTASRVKVCNIGNRTDPQFNMLPVVWDVFVEKYEKFWLIDKSLLIQWIHTCYQCKSLLLSYIDNIPTSAAIFVYNGAFDIARSVRNVSGCTLLRDVK